MPLPNTFKYFFVPVAIILLLLLYYFNTDIVSSQSSDINPKSIAVLPYDYFSPNPDDEYLSDGFTEVI